MRGSGGGRGDHCFRRRYTGMGAMVQVQSITYVLVQRGKLKYATSDCCARGKVRVDRSNLRQPTLLPVCHTAPHLLCMYVHMYGGKRGMIGST